MGKFEIEKYLYHLAIDLNVAKSTQDQAFKDVSTTRIYTHVMNKDLKNIDSPIEDIL